MTESINSYDKFLTPIDKLASALAKAQAKFKHVEKDATNPFFKSKYSTLDAQIEASKHILAENELSVSQLPISTENMAGVRTILMHSSGQYLENSLLLPVKEKTAQAYGSAITYARRYSHAAILGLTSGEDDDGNAASQQQAYKPQPKHDAPKVVSSFYMGTEVQKNVLNSMFGKYGITDKELMKKTHSLFIDMKMGMDQLDAAVREIRDDGI